MPASRLPALKPRAQRGFTLVELMIASSLSLILLGALSTITLSVRQSYRVQSALAQLQEDARYIFYLLGRDLRSAASWGCARPERLVNHLDDPEVAGPPPAEWDFLGNAISASILSAHFDGLELRTTGAGVRVRPPFGPLASANLKVESPNKLAAGDIVLATDCSAGDIFVISAGNPGTSGTVVHNTGSAPHSGLTNYNQATCAHGANAHCLSKVYGEGAMIYPLTTIRYSVVTSANGSSTLVRTENGVETEITSGIEELHFLYGEDTNGDGSVERYVAASDANLRPDRIVSVRVGLGLLSREAGSDRQQRRKFTATVALRSRAR